MMLMQNLTGAFRAAAKAPGFTFVVVVILALGIGANTVIFTLLNAALLRPLPYRDPSALLSVTAVDRNESDRPAAFHTRTIDSWPIAAAVSEDLQPSRMKTSASRTAVRQQSWRPHEYRGTSSMFWV
jgi:hypothetical protein